MYQRTKIGSLDFHAYLFCFHHSISSAAVEVEPSDFFTSVSNNHLVILFVTKMKFGLCIPNIFPWDSMGVPFINVCILAIITLSNFDSKSRFFRYQGISSLTICHLTYFLCPNDGPNTLLTNAQAAEELFPVFLAQERLWEN